MHDDEADNAVFPIVKKSCPRRASTFRLKSLQLPECNFALGTNVALVIQFPPSPLQKSCWQRARGREP